MKVVQIPNGNFIPLGLYVATWKRLKLMNPEQEVEGWDWFPMKVKDVLRNYSEGVSDRINKKS